MTLNELDQLLLDWQRNLDLASQNLLYLQSLPTYQRLAGEGGFSKAVLVGQTAAAVEPALEAMHDLFQQYDLLSQTVERALFLRRQINSFWGTDPRQQNVIDILNGKSIQLETTVLPASQIGLLSPAEQNYCVTPADLLSTMQSAFDQVRDQVLAIDYAWATLESKLLNSLAEIEALEAQGADLSLAKVQLDLLQDQIYADPLGVSDEFEQHIAPLIAQAQHQHQQAAAERQQVEIDLKLAQQQIQQLQQLYQKGLDLQLEVGQKVQIIALPPVDLTALKQWLLRLEAKFTEGSFAPVQIGLQNWTTQIRQTIRCLEAAISTQTQLLKQRQELYGRLEALQAKAKARGMAQDSTLLHFAAQANQSLSRQPSDLKTAAELIAGYERWLNRER